MRNILAHSFMHHYMKLQSEPFSKIFSGTKKIEIRLFDEMKQQLKVDDLITFTMMNDESKSLQSKIVDLVSFDSFKDLFDSCAPVLYGSQSSDQYEFMYKYYSREDEEKYGVLAIHLQIV